MGAGYNFILSLVGYVIGGISGFAIYTLVFKDIIDSFLTQNRHVVVS